MSNVEQIIPKPVDWKAIIDKLTPAQRKAFDLICIGVDGWYSHRVLKVLESKGLIVVRESILPGHPPVRVKAYDAPLPVHIAWAEWCTEHHK